MLDILFTKASRSEIPSANALNEIIKKTKKVYSF